MPDPFLARRLVEPLDQAEPRADDERVVVDRHRRLTEPGRELAAGTTAPWTTVAGESEDALVAFFTSPEMTRALGEPPVTIDDDTLVVCTRFRLVERHDEPPP